YGSPGQNWERLLTTDRRTAKWANLGQHAVAQVKNAVSRHGHVRAFCQALPRVKREFVQSEKWITSYHYPERCSHENPSRRCSGIPFHISRGEGLGYSDQALPHAA